MKDAISTTEIIETRQIIGQLNWLDSQTRPDRSHNVSALSFILKLKIECIKQANRVVKKAKKKKSQIDISDSGNFAHSKIIEYSDAPFANLTDGWFQGGYIISCVGNSNKYVTIVWKSKHIKRVVKSTLAAETLAMVDMPEAYQFYKNQLLEQLQLKDKIVKIKIICKTDISNLYDSVYSST